MTELLTPNEINMIIWVSTADKCKCDNGISLTWSQNLYKGRTNFILPCSVTNATTCGKTSFFSPFRHKRSHLNKQQATSSFRTSLQTRYLLSNLNRISKFFWLQNWYVVSIFSRVLIPRGGWKRERLSSTQQHYEDIPAKFQCTEPNMYHDKREWNKF